jgi:hypothetical protein
VITPGEAWLSLPEASVPVARSSFLIPVDGVAELTIEEEGGAVVRLEELVSTRWARRGRVSEVIPPPSRENAPGGRVSSPTGAGVLGEPPPTCLVFSAMSLGEGVEEEGVVRAA